MKLPRVNSLRLVALALLALSCGGGKASPGSLNGTIRGESVRVADVISGDVSSQGQSFGVVMLTDHGSLCDLATRRIVGRSSHYISFSMSDVSGSSSSSPPAGPGSYTVDNPLQSTRSARSAYLIAEVTDAQCTFVREQMAWGISGTVTLTKVAAGVYAATFDVTLNTGEHITGNFEAAACAAIGSFGQGSFTCQ